MTKKDRHTDTRQMHITMTSYKLRVYDPADKKIDHGVQVTTLCAYKPYLHNFAFTYVSDNHFYLPHVQER